MANEIDEDFIGFCRQASDSQLENILQREYEAYEHRDYYSALIAAGERGWRVRAGQRIN